MVTAKTHCDESDAMTATAETLSRARAKRKARVAAKAAAAEAAACAAGDAQVPDQPRQSAPTEHECDSEAGDLPTLEENITDGDDDDCDGLTLEENVDAALACQGNMDDDELILEENESSDCDEPTLEENVADTAGEHMPRSIGAPVPLGSGLLGLPASPSSLIQAPQTTFPGSATGATASPRGVKRRGTRGRGRPRKPPYSEDVWSAAPMAAEHFKARRECPSDSEANIMEAKRPKELGGAAQGSPAMATGCTGATLGVRSFVR
jgi:hypothetical protein